METSPLLAHREIPRKERLQKALVVLLLTIVVVAGAWAFSDGALRDDPRYLFALGFISLSGLCSAAYLWFRKKDVSNTKEGSRFIRRRIEDDRQGRGWTSRIGYNAGRFLCGIVVLVGALFVIAGLGIVAFQAYGYLRTGEWGSVSIFNVVSPYWPWLINPQSWFGLHKIAIQAFNIMPLSLALVVIGWLVAGTGSAWRDRIS